MESLPPKGFWSYARADDRNSGGQVSQLREKLANEIEILVGPRPPVEIWQDTSDIPGGSVWREQIGQAIGHASFFVAVLTPGFLHSRWCSEEVLRFKDREVELGRGDLIFPFVFADTGDLGPADCHDPEVFRLLMDRQVTIFHDLRYYDIGSFEVRARIGRFATAIRGALRRAATPSDSGAPERSIRSGNSREREVGVVPSSGRIAATHVARGVTSLDLSEGSPGAVRIAPESRQARKSAEQFGPTDHVQEALIANAPAPAKFEADEMKAAFDLPVPDQMRIRRSMPIWMDILIVTVLSFFLYMAIQSDNARAPSPPGAIHSPTRNP